MRKKNFKLFFTKRNRVNLIFYMNIIGLSEDYLLWRKNVSQFFMIHYTVDIIPFIKY